MYDGNWWNGAAWTQSWPPVPYLWEDHTRRTSTWRSASTLSIRRSSSRLHDTIAGGSPARVTPVYYKYGLPGSYDENWALS